MPIWLSVLGCVLLWPPLLYMLVDRSPRTRFVPPQVVADVPNITFRGGLF